MNKDDIEKIIIETLTEMGIYVDVCQVAKENETDDGYLYDIDLRNYIFESIMFISFVVELENKLGIEFPDELLFIDSISSLNGFSFMLAENINNNKKGGEPNEKEPEKTSS